MNFLLFRASYFVIFWKINLDYIWCYSCINALSEFHRQRNLLRHIILMFNIQHDLLPELGNIAKFIAHKIICEWKFYSLQLQIFADTLVIVISMQLLLHKCTIAGIADMRSFNVFWCTSDAWKNKSRWRQLFIKILVRKFIPWIPSSVTLYFQIFQWSGYCIYLS